jgi:hypothetical protein
VIPYDSTSQDPTILGYEFLKYHWGFVNPEDAFPGDAKQRFLDRMSYMDATYGGKTVSGFLQDLLTEGFIDDYAKNRFEELYQRLSIPTDIVQTMGWIESEIDYARSTSIESCLSRYMVLSVFQSYNQVLRYFEEIAINEGLLATGGAPMSVRSANCNFWQHLGCVLNLKTFLYTIGGALAGCSLETIIEVGWAGILQMIQIQLSGGNLQIVIRCGAAIGSGNPVNVIGIGVGATVGLLFGIISQWQNCSCPDCDGIKSMTYRFDDCDPEARFRPWGYGDDIEQFDWSNSNGQPSMATTFPAPPNN